MLFPEIHGQPKATKLLSRALKSSRLAHAYLYVGPDGVGKATTARSMAAILFCRNETGSLPCGSCSGCLKFMSANHPDFLHVLPEGAGIKIDQVRELKKSLGFPPLESKMRVTLIEDVHTMRREAANSLLKLLEEPPPDNVLLLTADESEPLLETITSRCQIIPFYPLPLATACAVLMQLDPELDQDSAATLATLAGGCPGQARTFDTDGLLQLHGEIIEALLRDSTSEAEQTEAALLMAVRTAEKKDSLEPLLDLFRIFFKEVMVTLLHPTRAGSGPSYMAPFIARARERWNLAQLSDSIQAIDFAGKALARNCNRQMVCEVLFLQLLAAPINDSRKS
jgi:DNA polymerase-3 subunit delta'